MLMIYIENNYIDKFADFMIDADKNADSMFNTKKF